MKKRIIFDILLLGALFYTPWWVLAVLAFLGAFFCESFYEVILLGLLADLLYGANMGSYHGFLGVVSAALIFVAALYTRKILR
jgi:hypothetical protein